MEIERQKLSLLIINTKYGFSACIQSKNDSKVFNLLHHMLTYPLFSILQYLHQDKLLLSD